MDQSKFHERLFYLLETSLRNYYPDNFDEERYGRQRKNLFLHLRKTISNFIFFDFIRKKDFMNVLKRASALLETHGQKLEAVYALLANDESKDWLVNLVAYRILGSEKIKLPTNTPEYFAIRDSQKQYLDPGNFVKVFFLGKETKLFLGDLHKLGLDIKVYSAGLDHIFIHQQHKYRNLVVPETGDVVLDCGACYGDSCLYFANLVGETGKVFSFEFIPEHIDVFNKNLELNPSLRNLVTLVKHPLWDEQGKKVFYVNNGPGSRVEFNEFDGFDGVTETQTIDGFYHENKLTNLDFIKMDIEGAELFALRGGEEIIRKHKPKLAISSYHSMDDFVNIPLWIDSLGLGYKIYLDHSTIHWEETVVFAKAG